MSNDTVGGTNQTTNSQYYVASSSTDGNTGADTVQGILDIVLASNINEQTEYVENLADQVNTLNIQMANDNAAEEAANACASTGCSGSDATFTYTNPTTGATSTETVSTYCSDNGIATAGTSKSDWSTTANNLQTDCSTLSNDAQLLNVDLQTGMNNLSNTNQLLSTVNKSFTDTNQDIIRNV